MLRNLQSSYQIIPVENGEVENVEVSSETASQQVAEKVESISETRKIRFLNHHRQGVDLRQK